MVNRIKLRLGAEEDKGNLEDSLAVIFQRARKDPEHKYHLGFAQFENPNQLVNDAIEQTHQMVTNSVGILDFEEDIDITIKSFPPDELLTGGMYSQERSSDQIAVIQIPFLHLLDFLYDGSDFTQELFNVQTSITHELRHHIDRRGLRNHFGLEARENPKVMTLDSIILGSAVKARSEGFPSFEPDFTDKYDSWEEYSEDLRDHTIIAQAVFDFVRKKQPISYKGPDIKDYLTLRSITNNGTRRSRRLAKKNHSFTSYAQGPKLFEVICLSGLKYPKDLCPIPKDVYHATLNQTKDLNLLQFYQTYFRALKDLGLNNEHSIFPIRKTPQTIRDWGITDNQV